ITRLQSGGVLEIEAQHLAVAFDRKTVEERSGRNNFLTIRVCQRPRCQPAADIELVARMELDLITDVDDHRHSRLWLAHSQQLCFTQLSPVTLIGLGFVRVPVSELHEVERKIVSPRSAPVANHEGKQRAILISAARVTLALIPNSTANRERNQRRD